MAQISWNRAGVAHGARHPGDLHHPVLQGCRSTSRASLAELRQFVQKQHPVVGQADFPGLGLEPPPVRAAAEMVWWGTGRGRWVSSGFSRSVSPWTLQIFVDSRASCPGHLRAIWRAAAWPAYSCPRAQGPTIKNMVSPAAAISRPASHAAGPFTSAKSGWGSGLAGGSRVGPEGWPPRPVRWAMSWATLSTDRPEFLRQGGLRCRVRRHEEPLNARLPGRQGHGQHPPTERAPAGEAHLPTKGAALQVGLQGPGGLQNAHQNGQVVDGAVLLPVGGERLTVIRDTGKSSPRCGWRSGPAPWPPSPRRRGAPPGQRRAARR